MQTVVAKKKWQRTINPRALDNFDRIPGRNRRVATLHVGRIGQKLGIGNPHGIPNKNSTHVGLVIGVVSAEGFDNNTFVVTQIDIATTEGPNFVIIILGVQA